MAKFLDDYPSGKAAGRYIEAALPMLPFSDQAFDLALCSHFLFLYSEQCNLTFHIESIRELARVASEVRIFPLLELGAQPSRHLGATVTSGLKTVVIERFKNRVALHLAAVSRSGRVGVIGGGADGYRADVRRPEDLVERSVALDSRRRRGPGRSESVKANSASAPCPPARASRSPWFWIAAICCKMPGAACSRRSGGSGSSCGCLRQRRFRFRYGLWP